MSTLEIELPNLVAQSVEIADQELIVTLADGRRISTPLHWYPRLSRATEAERASYEITPLGIHWPAIDEDLSIIGMLKGRPAGRDV